MNAAELKIDKLDTQKLLSAASGDAALLYLYLKSGNDPKQAETALKMTATRISCAGAILRQLGLWQEEKRIFLPGDVPVYSERDVLEAMEADRDFRYLYGEVQRLLGKPINTEEMKIILRMVRYLGLSPDVISVLVCYCKDRAKQQGKLRNPSLRVIESEAQAWADRGIDTMEEASAFIQAQNMRHSRLGQLLQQLQIRGRNLTPGEEKYANRWLDAGFEPEVIGMAYERTCLNTGGLNWAYMNKILTRWQQAGLLTAEQVRSGDKKVSAPKGATGELGTAELQNIQRLLQEG